jgi:hypothetical protein
MYEIVFRLDMARPKIKRIHINQYHIRSNKTKDTDLPVITIKEGKKIHTVMKLKYLDQV